MEERPSAYCSESLLASNNSDSSSSNSAKDTKRPSSAKRKRSRSRSNRVVITFDASHWLIRLLTEETVKKMGNVRGLHIQDDRVRLKSKKAALKFRDYFISVSNGKKAKWRMAPEWTSSLIHSIEKEMALRELGVTAPKPGMTEEEVQNLVFSNRLKISVLPLLTWIKHVAEVNQLDVMKVIEMLEDERPEVYLSVLVKVGVISQKEYDSLIEHKGGSE